MKVLSFFLLGAVVGLAGISCSAEKGDGSKSTTDALDVGPAYRFDAPHDWNVSTAAGSPSPGVEPLNVIITGDSNVPLNTILARMEHVVHRGGVVKEWLRVGTGTGLLDAPISGACISAETATVSPDGRGTIPQIESLRVDGCAGIAEWGENHARMWIQTSSGAAFFAVSREEPCLLGVRPWHCIESDGYNRGRDELVDDLKKAGENQGWAVDCKDVERPSGVGLNGVAFDAVATACAITKLR